MYLKIFHPSGFIEKIDIHNHNDLWKVFSRFPMAEVIAAQSDTLTQALSQIAQYISSSWLTCKFSTKDENHIKTVNKVKDIVARQKSKQARTLTNIQGHAVHLDKSLGDNVRHDLNRVYVSIDGDNIGASVERAAMADDLATIISQSQKIESGSKLITKWAEDHDGDIYIAGGDDVAFTLPKESISLLNELKQRYQDVTDYTITIGVGDSISKAGHAMLFGKMNGKNQINIWNRSIEDFVQKNAKTQTPAEKIAEHGLFDSKKASKLIKSLALRMNRPKKTKDPSVSVGVGVGVSSVKRRDENKNLLKKSDSLEKDVGRITFKNIEPKITRPDQEVKPVTNSTSAQQAAHHIANSVKRFWFGVLPDMDALKSDFTEKFINNVANNTSEGGMSANISNTKGQSRDSVTLSNMKYPALQEHEGLHHLVNMVAKHANMNNQQVYAKLNAHIHPTVNQLLDKHLEANPNRDAEKLAYLRDMIVHKGRRDEILSGVDPANHAAIMTYARQSFRNARRWAKNATLSDLEKSQTKQDLNQFKGLNIIGDKEWKDPKPKEGLAAGKKPSEFDPKQLKMGVKVESEHSKEKDVQQKIAMDHLTEDPKYYTHLNEMEEKYSKDIQKSSDNTISNGDIPQVASVAVIDGDKILFGLRRDNKRWTLPGGHLNENEHPDTGALRELKEEANIVPKNIHKLGSKEIVCEDGIKRHIHAYVAFGSSKATNKNDPDKEMKKWEWIEMNSDKLLEILKNLHSPKNVTLNMIGVL